MKDLRQRLERCFLVAFPSASAAGIRRASIGSLPEWDSLVAVNLVALVEEEFNISLPVDAISRLVSFELFADEIQRHDKSAAA